MILPAPMLLHTAPRLPPVGQPGWIYELKFDGYRMVAGVNRGQAQLATRKGSPDWVKVKRAGAVLPERFKR